MSTSNYLNTLRKSDLVEFAELSDLPDYATLKKYELAEQLDEHLRRNASRYGNEPDLSDYYKRLNSGSRSPVKSPVKRIAEKVSDMVKSDDDGPRAAPSTSRKSRRRTQSPEEDDEPENAIIAAIKTPGKAIRRTSSIIHGETPLIPSPAVVTDVIDQQTKRIRRSISHAYEHTHIQQGMESFRDYLSSAATVNIAAILLELYGLERNLIPFKHFTTIGPIPLFKSSFTQISLPDLFQLLTHTFWASIILWTLSTLVVPAMASYLINIPLSRLPKHTSARKAGVRANPHIQFDPFVFNVTKALVAYLVFGLGLHFKPYALFDNSTVMIVNLCMPGGWWGLVLGSGIGAAVSLYEAVLRK